MPVHQRESKLLLAADNTAAAAAAAAAAPQTIIKGRKLVLAEHVKNVAENRQDNGSYLMKSRIIRQALVHATPYTTPLYINATRCVIAAQCNCVYNKFKKVGNL
ncbi:hypothetical protein PV325_000258 [Microctonus aethiopoides]|nr:hypothetical protein PV325_000258 [Microctonus aethiopoides]